MKFFGQDSGLWLVTRDDGAELGYIFDGGASGACEKCAAYQALDGWHNIEPGNVVGTARSFMGAAKALRQYRESASRGLAAR